MGLVEDTIFQNFNFVKPEDFPHGFRCDEGWGRLIFETCEKLEEAGFDGKITTIKEKFAGLRIRIKKYSNKNSKKFKEIIDKAEEKSYLTCELCGDYGLVYSIGGMYIKTMCKVCVSYMAATVPVFVYYAGVKENDKTET